jgi:hypothetical protein
VDWPSYLRRVVSATAGAAAGVAASVAGPIAVASAGAAAGKLSGDLLEQFLGAHADQMQRIEELGKEMHGQLIGLQNTVGGLLDAPWRTALAHIDEAGRRPGREAQELELARANLFEAWGVAEGLLERDTSSQDPAALRGPLIAQQIAALYSFLGEPLNTVHWLTIAYTANRNLVNNQVDSFRDSLVQRMKRASRMPNVIGGEYPHMYISVDSTDPNSKDPLWLRAPGRAFSLSGARRHVGCELWRKHGVAERDLEFEGRVAVLVVLDAEAQLLRRTCLEAGVDEVALPSESGRKGARKAAAVTNSNDEMLSAIVVFDSTIAVQFDFVGRSARKRIDSRYQKIPRAELISYWLR